MMHPHRPRSYFCYHPGDLYRARINEGSHVMVVASAHWDDARKRYYIKRHSDKRPFWEFLDRQPDGWVCSLAYERDDVPMESLGIGQQLAWLRARVPQVRAEQLALF